VDIVSACNIVGDRERLEGYKVLTLPKRKSDIYVAVRLPVSGNRIYPELVRGSNKATFLQQDMFLSHSRCQ
jgi:hypothetical protein